MEWREQSTVSCQDAYVEAERWIEAVTKKTFKGKDFRSALENGVLLCDLINKIKPGIIKRVNRLPTPIAGLDNINVFLKACLNIGLKEAQLFHPGDLQDLSSRVTVKDEETDRRLKNVLITLYWLGRKAQGERSYDGPYLNFKAFEGLLGTALHKALQELSGQKGNCIQDSDLGDNWYSEREERHQLRGGGWHRREDSLDSLDSLGSQTLSLSSDATLKGSSEGCCSDAEADAAFKMSNNKESLSYRRSVTLTPKVTTQFNQFLPTKDKATGYVPAPLRKKRTERNDDNRRSWANPVYMDEDDLPITSDTTLPPGKSSTSPSAHPQSAIDYESGSDSDSDRPDPDVIMDDLASRRFHSPPPAPPANFSIPISLSALGMAPAGQWPRVTVSPSVARSSDGGEQRAERRPPVSTESIFSDPYANSEDEDDEVGYADPVQDDLYARKVGARNLVAGDASYHKFLPKLWTPEEDVHIQKIKLGSQSRPWYRKMQGFSHEKSGSSSDDSEPDVAPALSSGPSSSHPSTTQSALIGGKSPPMHTHSSSHRPKTTLLETPPLRFTPVDPTSGPRLVKCQQWPLLGRQDPREPPDPIDYESIIPDLENDDMFARRTLTFQANSELATVKTPLSAKRCLWTSKEQINIVTQLHKEEKEEEEFPDIEQDDVVQRREKIEQQQRPLSGAPDNFSPMAITEPWDLPPELKTRLLCPPSPLTQESSSNKSNHVLKEPCPEMDDMLVRKLAAQHNQVSANQATPSVPTSCSEGDLQRWQAIREASQRRYKKKLMVEILAKKIYKEVSKSTNDVNEEPVLVRRQSQYEALEKYREQVKQSDDRWQDDLSKWKNRRKSVNSDIVKKKEEREMVEQITSGGSTRRPKTYKEMQDERQNRRTSSIGSRMGSLSFDNDNDVFENPKPRPRESISRSYTVDTLYHSSGSYESARKEDKPPEVPLRSTKQGSDAIDAPGVTTTRGSFHRLKPSEATPSQRSSVFESTTKTEEISRPPKASQKVPEPKSPVKVQPPSSAAIYKPSLQSKTEANAATVSRISASLPRSYQRSDSARLSSVITPRPFGTQLSRVGSLNRTVTSDESNSRINGNAAISKNSSVPSRYHQFMTAEDEAESQSSPVQSSEDDDDTPEETMVKSVTSTSSVSSRTIEIKREVLATEPSKESTCEMRVSLNQKPNSSRDFGFDVAWDSSGAHVKAIQPGSPAEMFQLQAGDEVLTVNGQRVADMSYLDWKASMDRALQEGSLVMDIRRYGKSNWDRDPSSPLFKGHKTINLTTRDHPILVGFADAGGAMLDFTSLTDTSAKATSHSLVDVASNGIAGGYPKVSMMTQESEPISMINLKRRSEFFEKGAVDSAMPDIPVPPITASSTRWSWDPEEERRRQEKWQKEQERQLQEKYKRDQEKLQEEWTKAQQEISSSFPQSEPVGSTLAYRELQQERERLELERKRRGEEEEQERMKLEMERKLREEEFERQRQEMRRREEELEQERQEIDRKRREQEQELERQRQEMRRREEELERLKLEEERRKKEAEEERQRQAEEERRRIREKEEEEERRKREEEEERQRQAEEERRRIREKEEEEERRKREEEEERQRQAEEERRMIREKEEEEERRKREEEELLWQRRREAEKEELRRRLAATDEQQWQGRRHTFEEQRAKSLDNEERLPSSGVFVYRSSVALRLLEEQAKSTRDKMAHGQRAVSELEKQRRNLLNAKRYREPERVMGGDAVDAKFAQPPSQAELQRQQLLNDMRKKTNLLTDSSWIRQRSATTPGHEDLPSTRRGGSLDHLDKPLNSWRSSWAPRSESYIPNYSRPHSAIYGSAPVFGGGPPGAGSGASSLPPSFRGPAAGATSWSRQSASPLPSSVSPTTSSEPGPDTGGQRQRSRSVSGKKVCTLCDTALGKGAAMIIESLGLCYHLNCFKCIDCKSVLGGSEAGAEVRIRNKQLYCNTCYMRFKTGQPTPM
ncbi:LIM domain only protein 7 isoform X7 [Hippocampus zosterae]|uniref:LIM domain only protein 7 isoform X7 n=1 Tax=Hippocampus zosterae TaxID=109293 RepID=UPI00223E4DFE|nr:LIM domain only protein 7 isoform X7 [Hippocampus zosterae]